MITAPLLALAAALALTPVMIGVARRLGWVARPTEDRWHRVPTALVGGTAIFAAASLGWALLPPIQPLAAIWLGGALLALGGFVDDRWHLSPVGKLAFQLAGALILIWNGLLLVPTWPLWVSAPLTLFWVVGITNAINLLDNMDGLAAGVSAIAAVTLGVLALGSGNPTMATAAFVLAAAALGFLAYNYNPAKTFMGDCGSLFLGFTLSGFALAVPSAGSGHSLTALLLVPAAVLAVPIFDTTLVTAKRLLVGRSVGQGGRDHSSHRLVTLGFTERGAVLTLYGVAAGFGLIAFALQRTGVGLGLPLFIYATIALAAFGVFLSSLHVYDPETEGRGRLRMDGRASQDHVLLRAAFRHKNRLIGAAVDGLLVIASFLAAVYLRYEGAPPDPVIATITRALPAIVFVKLVTFQVFGIYRGLPWHVRTPEVLRAVGASAIASFTVVVVLFVLSGLQGLSPPELIIDAILAAMAIAGVRLSFRFFRGLQALFVLPQTRGALVDATADIGAAAAATAAPAAASSSSRRDVGGAASRSANPRIDRRLRPAGGG